jgi:pimeloyl-ACP methyl ester carboxylesterase
VERFRNLGKDLGKLVELETRSHLFINPPDSYLEHNAGKSPVILIPGLLESWGVLRTIGDWVSAQSHDVWTVPELGKNNIYDIKKAAGIVEDIIDRNGLCNAVLITHSKGGLIGKQILIDGLAEKMFAIATPFSGSGPARWVPYGPVKEVSSKSRIVKSLNEETEANSKIISLFFRHDRLIPRGCYLEGALDNIPIKGEGHFTILEHPEVIAKIILYLWAWEQ